MSHVTDWKNEYPCSVKDVFDKTISQKMREAEMLTRRRRGRCLRFCLDICFTPLLLAAENADGQRCQMQQWSYRLAKLRSSEENLPR